MRSTSFLLLLLTVLLLFSCGDWPSADDSGPASWPASRPNIVWLVAEDLSPILAPFGDSTVRTPNLERLAAEGIRFPNTFSTSGVCAPSRATLATGMYHNSIGAHNMRVQWNTHLLEQVGLAPYEVVPPPEVRMMSELLRANGYYCTNNDKTDYQFKPTITAWDDSSPYAHWRNRGEGQPFFSIFNFEITHESQVFGPHGYKQMRYNDTFPLDREKQTGQPYSGRQDSSQWQLFVPEDLEVPIPPYLPDTEPVRRDVRRVYSNIVELDRQIGLILRQLEADGLLDQTIIVFYGDHGGPLPRQKRLLYDSGLRVPMIMRFPGGWRAGEVDSQLVSFVDFAPMTFALAGIDPPDYLQGQTFLTRDGKAPADQRKYIHAAADRMDEYYDMKRAVRDHRFKYIRYFKPAQPFYLPVAYREQMVAMQELLRLRDAGQLDEYQAQWFRTTKPEEELFDTWNDPYELHDLAKDPAYADKLAELRAECERWMKAVDDKGFIPEKELRERFWPGGEQPVTAEPEVTIDDGLVNLSCPTAGASIGYKVLTSGQEPPAWMVYTAPFKLPEGARLKVRAQRIGYAPSPVVE